MDCQHSQSTLHAQVQDTPITITSLAKTFVLVDQSQSNDRYSMNQGADYSPLQTNDATDKEHVAQQQQQQHHLEESKACSSIDEGERHHEASAGTSRSQELLTGSISVLASDKMVDAEAPDDNTRSKSSQIDVLEMEPSTPETSTEVNQKQNALSRKLRNMRDQRRRLSSRQRVAVVVGVLPVAICSLEMIPDRCRICRQDVQMDAYIFTAAICGGFAAVIYGNSLDYWMPRLVGGASAALGSLFTNWMLLTSIPSNWAFLLIVFGVLGAMPGLVIYFSLKIMADECFVTDQDVEDDYEEIAPLTKIRMVSVN